MNEYRWVRNANDLAVTKTRTDALGLIESALDAIDTTRVIREKVRLDGETLSISSHSFDLSAYRRVCLLGFGKAACQAAQAIEQILGDRVQTSRIIQSASVACEHPEHSPATHPLPSEQNLEPTQQMLHACGELGENDLALVIISGGGSAMLCDSISECEQGRRLYGEALKKGLTIQEINTVRKHISRTKGGGLAERLSPARVVGLIFSDVPGTSYDLVASGPTWPDVSTIADAQAVLDRYGLPGYMLNETPKDSAIFTGVTNIVLVSNISALRAMADRAMQYGYRPDIFGNDLYDTPEKIYALLAERAAPRTAVIAGGEFRIMVPDGGKGGRNTRATLVALREMNANGLFIAFASDGRDNTDAAGAIADAVTRRKLEQNALDIRTYLERYDDYPFFEKTGDLIMTGPTGANVSDLMFLLTE